MLKGSIPALITPFTPTGEVDFSALSALMTWHCEMQSDGIVLCGSTGESATLSHEEKLEIFSVAVKTVQGRIPVIAGTGTNDTRTTLRLTQEAQELGVDACLLITPYYNRPTPEGCYLHFEEISRLGLPMILYHNPARTGSHLQPAALAHLATLPHMIAIKDATGDIPYLIDLLRISSVPVFTGDDVFVVAAMAQGCVGSISTIANVIPSEWKELCSTLSNNDFARGRAIYQHYLPLIKAMSLEPNPQCVKYALSLLQRCAARMRLPLLEPRQESKQRIELAMQETGSLDLLHNHNPLPVLN